MRAKHLLHDFHSRLVSALRTPGDHRPVWREGIDAVLGQLDGLAPAGLLQPVPPPAPGCLNIAVVCREYPPETAWGGMATYCYHLAGGLLQQGHRVTVVSLGRPSVRQDFDGRVNVVRMSPRAHGGSRSFESMRRRGQLSCARHMVLYSLALYGQLRALEEALGPFDLLDLPDHGAEGLVPILCGQWATAVRVHSPWSLLNCMRANFFTENDIEEMFTLERAALGHADAVTSPSRELASRIRTFFGLERVIPCVPNPLDISRFCPAERPPGPLRVGFAGRLEVRKGVTTLFEAVPAVLKADAGIEFHLAGQDVCGLQAIYRAHLDPGRVHFHGALPPHELPRFYQSADLVVVPSHYDNSPYTCVEAMACGVPVIGTSAGGMPEFIEHGKTGLLVPTRDAAALAAAILQLAGDPAGRRRMGAAGRQRMVETVDAGLVAHRLSEHYRQAIGRRSGSAISSLEVERALPAGPTLSPLRSLQAEVIILASPEDVQRMRSTLDSLRQQGRAIQSVVVLWQGKGRLPSFPGCRVFSAADNLVEVVARVLATLLTDLVLCLQAGDTLDRTATTKITWPFAALQGVGVVTLPSGRQTGQGRAVYPAFRSEAVRGRPLAIPGEAGCWREILQLLYDRVHQDGWREAVVDEPALIAGTTCCQGLPLAEVVSPTPHSLLEAGLGSLPLPASPAGARPAPSCLRGMVHGGIRALSGPLLQPLRYRVRRWLRLCGPTRRLAAWLRRERGSLSTGGFTPPDEGRLGAVVLARTLPEGLQRWREVHHRPRGSFPVIVLTGEHPGPQSVCRTDAAVYHLDSLLPREFHSWALAQLLRQYS